MTRREQIRQHYPNDQSLFRMSEKFRRRATSGNGQRGHQIRAKGKVLNCGSRVGAAEGPVTDTKGRLLAHGTTTCLIFLS
jgi:hypothetical protein